MISKKDTTVQMHAFYLSVHYDMAGDAVLAHWACSEERLRPHNSTCRPWISSRRDGIVVRYVYGCNCRCRHHDRVLRMYS